MTSGAGEATWQRVQRASSPLSSTAVRAAEQLPWFAALPAEQRSYVGLVLHTGLDAFAQWLRAPEQPLPVAVRGLTVRHPGQSEDALAGLDLDLAPGRRIAVVGPSGSGKTTLAQALLRFLEPGAGSVTFAAGRPQAVDSRALAGSGA